MKLRRLITKRACVRLTLLLIAGAIVNVAVAWGCDLVVFEPLSLGKSGIKRVGEARFWRASIDRFPNRDIIHSSIWSGFCTGCDLRRHPLDAVPSEWRQRLGSFETDSSMFRSRKIIVLGWPKRVVWRTEDSVNPMALPATGVAFQHHVLWPGFAINTVFYAAILWGLLAVPFAWRRRLRVKRGLCVKCAYDLRGQAVASDVCPECGTKQASAKTV